LSAEGQAQALLLATELEPFNIRQIYCSSEPKTLATIQPFAQSHGITPVIRPDLDEIRSAVLPTADASRFFSQKRRGFLDIDSHPLGDEAFSAGLSRFNQALAHIKDQEVSTPTTIVSHGTVLTLFFAQLGGFLSQGEHMFQLWRSLPFCAIGVVVGETVIQSIFSEA